MSQEKLFEWIKKFEEEKKEITKKVENEAKKLISKEREEIALFDEILNSPEKLFERVKKIM